MDAESGISSEDIEMNPGGWDIHVQLGRSVFKYGYEPGNFVEGNGFIQTELTKQAFLSMSEALTMRMGGNPYGPAGTGKTESVKALARVLGRQIYVFCCDESYDQDVVIRLLEGLCESGAWGCFDEFNRLPIQCLSALSEILKTIQNGLKDKVGAVELTKITESTLTLTKSREGRRKRKIRLAPTFGIFITLNEGYGGRSVLPDSLKLLFRSISLFKPDATTIVEALFQSQGYVLFFGQKVAMEAAIMSDQHKRTVNFCFFSSNSLCRFLHATEFASHLVFLFERCKEIFEKQIFYDFSLRGIKAVVRRASIVHSEIMKSQQIQNHQQFEMQLVYDAIISVVSPKLSYDDEQTFRKLLDSVCTMKKFSEKFDPKESIPKILENFGYCSKNALFLKKCQQFVTLHNSTNGLILTGEPGSGKSAVIQTCAEFFKQIGYRVRIHTFHPKAMSKDLLFGFLDPTTQKWSDGVFTSTLRSLIVANQNKEEEKEDEFLDWFVFQGAIDPEWSENFNSVLDDNRLLSLPTGERLKFTENMKLIFESNSALHATPATISRVGVIYFPEETVSIKMKLLYLFSPKRLSDQKKSFYSKIHSSEGFCSYFFGFENHAFYGSDLGMNLGYISELLSQRKEEEYVMKISHTQILKNIHSIFKSYMWVDAKDLSAARIPAYLFAAMFVSTLKGISLGMMDSQKMTFILAASSLFFSTYRKVMPIRISEPQELFRGEDLSLLQFFPNPDFIKKGNVPIWKKFNIDHSSVKDRIQPSDLLRADVMIPTPESISNTSIVSTFLNSHLPVITCGPPGSGKSLLFASVLSKNSKLSHDKALDFEFSVLELSFSCATETDALIDAIFSKCRIEKTRIGKDVRYTLCPLYERNEKNSQNKPWLIVFLDEINLPQADEYDSVQVHRFLYSIIREKGFSWIINTQTLQPVKFSGQSLSEKEKAVFLELENIQICGACNPPTDPGRIPIFSQLLNEIAILHVGYPSKSSLISIFTCFAHGLFKQLPKLASGFREEQLSKSIVDVYFYMTQTYTRDSASHYIFSLRDISRWISSMQVAIASMLREVKSTFPLSQLCIATAYPLFHDRLVTSSERKACKKFLNLKFSRRFEEGEGHERLYLHTWNEDKECEFATKQFITNKLKVFAKNFTRVNGVKKIVIFDQLVDHLMTISYALRQPSGHLLLLGCAGGGKTLLSEFGSFIHGISVFALKVHSKYTSEDFDDDLKTLLFRCGLNNEQVSFIFDESNAVESSFLEKMNALLASGRVPGLFSSEELFHITSTIAKQTGSQYQKCMKIFHSRVRQNLHIIFTMNPAGDGYLNRQETSPALFNRCVVDWYGEWTSESLYQVGKSLLTYSMEESKANSFDSLSINIRPVADLILENSYEGKDPDQEHENMRIILQDKCTKALVFIYQSILDQNRVLLGETNLHVSSRDFFDLINHFAKKFESSSEIILANMKRILDGLSKFEESEREILIKRDSLTKDKEQLSRSKLSAERTMNEIIENESNARERKARSIELNNELKTKTDEIEKRKTVVETQLSSIGPLVADAKKALLGIKKEQLIELISFSNPPKLVRLVLQAVCTLLLPDMSKQDLQKLLGKKSVIKSEVVSPELLVKIAEKIPWDWLKIKKIAKNASFIKRILEFKGRIHPGLRMLVESKYLNSKQWNIGKIQKANVATGPLAIWCVAQCKYAQIVDTVVPLEQEIRSLEIEYKENSANRLKLDKEIDDLVIKVSGYKQEYAKLMSEISRTENKLSSIESSLEKSLNIISGLAGEKDRWIEAKHTFLTKICDSIPKSLIAAGIFTFFGIYDEHIRRNLFNFWTKTLTTMGFFSLGRKKFHSFESVFLESSEKIDSICFDTFHDELISSDQQMLWTQEYHLPKNTLYLQNAAILVRQIRSPLLLDPAGYGLSFILKLLHGKSVIQISGSSPNLSLELIKCLKYGYPLIVQDVDVVDPILNPVLNNEFYYEAGRKKVNIGGTSVFVSNQFQIFLVSRRVNHAFSNDLCSRVTFLKFSVSDYTLRNFFSSRLFEWYSKKVHQSESSLSSQSAGLQSQMKLIENDLLSELSKSSGNLLGNNVLISKLMEIRSTYTDLKTTMKEIGLVREKYYELSKVFLEFGQIITKLFRMLQSMNDVNKIYEYSLSQFTSIFEKTLSLIMLRLASSIQDPDNSDVFNLSEFISQDLQSDGHVSKLRKVMYDVMFSVGNFSYKSYRHSIFAVDSSALKLKFSFFLMFDVILPRFSKEIGSDRIRKLQNLFEILKFNSKNDIIRWSEESKIEISEFSKKLSQKIRDQLSIHEITFINSIQSIVQNDSLLEEFMIVYDIERLQSLPKYLEYVNSDHETSQFLQISEEKDFEIGADYTFSNFKKDFLSVICSKIFTTRDFRSRFSRFMKRISKNCSISSIESDLSEIKLHSITSICQQDPSFNSRTPLLQIFHSGEDGVLRIENYISQEKFSKSRIFCVSTPYQFEKDMEFVFSNAIEDGFWILIKNIHLLPSELLLELEQRLHNTPNIDPEFRLFLTANIESVEIPGIFIRNSVRVVNQVPKEISSAVSSIFDFQNKMFALPSNTDEVGSSVFADSTIINKYSQLQLLIYLMIGWIHSAIKQRVTYKSYGFSAYRSYVFGDIDLKHAFSIVSHYVEKAKSKSCAVDIMSIVRFCCKTIYLTKVHDPSDVATIKELFALVFLQSNLYSVLNQKKPCIGSVFRYDSTKKLTIVQPTRWQLPHPFTVTSLREWLDQNVRSETVENTQNTSFSFSGREGSRIIKAKQTMDPSITTVELIHLPAQVLDRVADKKFEKSIQFLYTPVKEISTPNFDRSLQILSDGKMENIEDSHVGDTSVTRNRFDFARKISQITNISSIVIEESKDSLVGYYDQEISLISHVLIHIHRIYKEFSKFLEAKLEKIETVALSKPVVLLCTQLANELTGKSLYTFPESLKKELNKALQEARFNDTIEIFILRSGLSELDNILSISKHLTTVFYQLKKSKELLEHNLKRKSPVNLDIDIRNSIYLDELLFRSRQHQSNQLDSTMQELSVFFFFDPKETLPGYTRISFKNLSFYAAKLDESNNLFPESDSIFTPLPCMYLQWIPVSIKNKMVTRDLEVPVYLWLDEGSIQIPAFSYLAQSPLFYVPVSSAPNVSPSFWARRGTGLVIHTFD